MLLPLTRPAASLSCPHLRSAKIWPEWLGLGPELTRKEMHLLGVTLRYHMSAYKNSFTKPTNRPIWDSPWKLPGGIPKTADNALRSPCDRIFERAHIDHDGGDDGSDLTCSLSTCRFEVQSWAALCMDAAEHDVGGFKVHP